MKHRLTRLSPHQNGKVVALPMAAASLVLLLPFGLFASFIAPQARFPVAAWVAVPVAYLVLGYLATVTGCVLYNLLARHTGGVEFETTSTASS